MGRLRVDTLETLSGVTKDVETLVTSESLSGAPISVSSYDELQGLTLSSDATYLIYNLFPEYAGTPGIYVYQTLPKSLHDGSKYISPTVPGVDAQSSGVRGWLAGNDVGSGSGILVRVGSLEGEGGKDSGDPDFFELYPLDLPMSDQEHTINDGLLFNGQAVHPSAIRIPGGFGSQSFEYWLAVTGYIEFDDQTETPMLFCSQDGMRWEIPKGATNPIAADPAGADFLSDVDIVYAGGDIHLYYRETDTTVTPSESVIWHVSSSDAVSWTTKSQVTGLPTSGDFIRVSPSITYEDGTFYCWIVDARSGGSMSRLSSSDGISFSNRVSCIFNGGTVGSNVWHLDVIKTPDGHGMISNASSHPVDVYYWNSYDGGVTWKLSNKVLDHANRGKDNYFYRCSMILDDDYQGASLYLTRGSAVQGNMRIVFARASFNGSGDLVINKPSGDFLSTRKTLSAPSAYVQNLHVGRMFGGSSQVLLGARENAESNFTSGLYRVNFDYIQRDGDIVIPGVVGDEEEPYPSIREFVVPEGYFQAKINYQLNLTGIGTREVISGVFINGTSEGRYGLPSFSAENTDRVNMNASGAWLSVVPGDLITLEVAITGSGNYNIIKSSWINIELK